MFVREFLREHLQGFVREIGRTLGAICNYTTYSINGVVTQFPFVERGPINLIGDHIQSEEFDFVDLTQQVTPFEFEYVFTGNIDSFEMLLEVADTYASMNQLVYFSLNGGTSFRLVWRNDDLTIIDTCIISYTPEIGERIKVSGVVDPDGSTLTINGVTSGASRTNAPVSCLVGVETYGARTGGAFEPDALLLYSNSGLTGFTDYYSNENDGTIFRSSTGVIMKLKSDGSGNEQLPNYSCPIALKRNDPATDGIQCDELGDTIIYESASDHAYTDNTDTHYIGVCYTLEEITFQKATLECVQASAGDKSALIFVLNTNGKFLYQMFDYTGVLVFQVDGTIINNLGSPAKLYHKFTILPEGSDLYTITITINGEVDYTVSNKNISAGFNLNRYTVDGTGAAPLIGKVFCLESDFFSPFYLGTRLLPNGETQLERKNEDEETIAIGNIEQIHPFQTDENAYLLEDHLCSDNNLVLKTYDDGVHYVAVTKNGTFVRKD